MTDSSPSPDPTPASASVEPCEIHAVVTTPGVLVCRYCGSKITATWLTKEPPQSAPEVAS